MKKTYIPKLTNTYIQQEQQQQQSNKFNEQLLIVEKQLQKPDINSFSIFEQKNQITHKGNIQYPDFKMQKFKQRNTSLSLGNNSKILYIIMFLLFVFLILTLASNWIFMDSKRTNKQINDANRVLEGITQTKLQKKILQDSVLYDSHFFPQQNIQYRIFAAMDPSLVAHIHAPINQQNHLIADNLMNTQNQVFYFKHVHNNKYKIYNKQLNKVMKVYNRSRFSWVKIVFQDQSNTEDQIWELIPANFTTNNCFNIRSFSGMFLHLQGQYWYKRQASILQTNFKTRNSDRFQKWVIEPVSKPNNQFNLQNYQKKSAQIFWKYNLVQEQYVQWLQFYQFKYENNISLPFWLQTPNTTINKDDLPPYDPQIRKKRPDLQFPSSQFFTCPKNHTVTYIWYGNKQMPPQYKNILTTCNETTKLLTQKDFLKYSEMWNQISEYKINSQEVKLRQQFDLLKLLYLYFESGIYSDFDTQINEECFSQVYADEIIFTNYWSFQYNSIVLPEENFLMVRRKHHPQIKRMLEQELTPNAYRWDQCSNRQCLILLCQRHFEQRSYTKGYD